jgi:hypothetical protein
MERLRQNPDLAVRPRHYLGNYIFPGQAIDQIMDGLRKAGLPEGAKAAPCPAGIEQELTVV